MDMTGTIAQVRPADERLAERLAEEYRQARIDMGQREAAAEWFTPLLRKWRRLLAGKGEGFTPREQLALAVTLDADLRDASARAADTLVADGSVAFEPVESDGFAGDADGFAQDALF